MSDNEVEFVCTVLVEAVGVLADAESSPLNRTEAQRFCEEVKEKPQLCISCGLRLTDRSKTIPVRRFGFQILEHHVTHHWMVATPEERMYLKSKLMDLMSAGANLVLEEEQNLCESMARVVVEMIKREEQEQWPTMLGRLRVVMNKGCVQAEMVMLVLLRLAEDVVSIEGQRPVPHYKVLLDSNMHIVLEMAKVLLENCVYTYRPEKKRVIMATLKTMAGYLAWVPIFHIVSVNYTLLNKMWGLLYNPDLRLEASECLLIALNNVATDPNTKPMLEVFQTVISRYVFGVPRTTVPQCLIEKRYSFLKNICQMMCLFGQQLCHIMSSTELHREAPSNFEKYLDSLLAFTTHRSYYLSSLTQSTWKALFSLERLSEDPHLLAAIPKYLSATKTKLLKVGFPSKNNSSSCEYSRFEFASDVEFYKFLTNFRGDQKQVIDVLCRLDRNSCFQMASRWLKNLLTPSINSRSYFLHWEAMTFFLKVIVTNMFQNLKKEDIPVDDVMELLQLLLNFKTKDPRILACVPINIYAFLPLFNFRNECLTQVITKLLEIIEDVNIKSHTCNSARRDASICILRICQGHGKLILPSFELLFNHVKQLLCDELLQLTQMVKSTLMEAMVVLINNFHDFEEQKAYLEELMAPVSSLWLSEEMQIVLADPESFVSYVGGDLMIIDTTVESPTDLNRSGIIHCVATILGVLRWTRSSTDLEKTDVVAKKKQVCLNPCAEQVLKLLDNLFVLIRTQHNLYFPGVLSKIGVLFSKRLLLPKIKNNSTLDLPQPLLDIYDPPEYKTTLERMQGFFSALYVSCFYILGCAGSSLNKDFYRISNLADKICNSAFVNLEYMPHYRLLCIIRVFLRPLLLNCPPEYYESLVSPVIGLFLTSVHLKRGCGWNDIDQKNLVSKEKSIFEKSKLEEKILLKEVLQLIIDCCVDQDKIVITDGQSVMNADHESQEEVCDRDSASASTVCSEDTKNTVSSAGSHVTEACVFASFCEDAEISVSAACSENAETFVSAFSSQVTDVNVAAAETDVCRVSHEDGCALVCTTNSEDDNLAISDACTSISNEEVDMDKESGFACHVPSENTGSSFEVNNICTVANRALDSNPVAAKTGTVCVLFEKIDASLVSSDNNDSEMAAEVPQEEHCTEQEQAPLTKLGICLMKDEDVRSALLNTSFSSLMWKDFCHKAATCLCWPLLQHVMFEPLLVDTVIHLFTMVMKGLQRRKHDPLVSDTFCCLAYRIYTSLRPRYIELNRVMRQIPNINLLSLDAFDEMLLDVAVQKPDNGLQQYFKDLIKSGVHEPFCDQGHSVSDIPKPTSKSMKRPMSTKLPQTAKNLKKKKKKRAFVETDGSEVEGKHIAEARTFVFPNNTVILNSPVDMP